MQIGAKRRTIRLPSGRVADATRVPQTRLLLEGESRRGSHASFYTPTARRRPIDSTQRRRFRIQAPPIRRGAGRTECMGHVTGRGFEPRWDSILFFFFFLFFLSEREHLSRLEAEVGFRVRLEPFFLRFGGRRKKSSSLTLNPTYADPVPRSVNKGQGWVRHSGVIDR